jgi:hypothetical protein
MAIKYSQKPTPGTRLVKDSSAYEEEKKQEKKKNQDIANPIEGDSMVDDNDGSDNG